MVLLFSRLNQQLETSFEYSSMRDQLGDPGDRMDHVFKWPV